MLLQSNFIKMTGHFCFIITLVICILFFSVHGIAQKDTAKTVPKLNAGDIYAEFPLQRGNKISTKGRFGFAEIKIFNRGKRLYRNVELILKADGAIINSVTDLKTGPIRRRTKNRNRRVIRIRRLSKHQPRIIWVELRLSNDTSQEVFESHLNITMNVPTRGKQTLSDSTQISWRISNCSASYHRALVSIGDKRIGQMKNLLKFITLPNRTLPGRWAFPQKPEYKLQKAHRYVCTRYRYVRNSRTRKYYRRCISSRKVTRTYYTRIKRPKNVREIFREANRFVYARAADPQIRWNSGNHWVLKKIYADLRRYLKQKSNPALCTGAIAMTGYYERKFGQIKRRGLKIHQLYSDAKSMAHTKTEEFIKLVTSQKDSSAVIQATKVSLQSQSEVPLTLNELMSKILSQVENEELKTAIMEQQTIPRKLIKFRTRIAEYKKALSLDKDTEKKLVNALSLIEATFYLEQVKNKYQTAINEVEGTITGIRNAHKTHCNCAN